MDTQVQTAELKPAKTKLKTFYLLFLVNHTNKEFMLRVENTPGTGIHSIQWFATAGADNLAKGYDKTIPWIRERFQWVVANCKWLEQSVIATQEAEDSHKARQLFKEQRRNICKSLQALGYRLYNQK
jgi:hypothetical protein